MPAVVFFVLHPHFVLPSHGAVSLIFRQWLALLLPSDPYMLGIASRARGNHIALDGKRLLAIAFDYYALGASDVDRTHLHFLHLVVPFDTLDNLCHRRRSPSPPTPFPTRPAGDL